MPPKNTKKEILNKHALDNKYIFIHINKTGGSSIEKALNLQREHKTALEKIKEVGVEKWNECFTFSIVRNPWDKVASHYFYRLKTNQTGVAQYKISFKQWVVLTYKNKNPQFYDKPKMFMPNSDWITNAAGKVLVDKVCKFENLHDEFLSVCCTLGIATPALPHLLKSDRKHYTEYYDEETANIIERHFKKDIKMFGFSF